MTNDHPHGHFHLVAVPSNLRRRLTQLFALVILVLFMQCHFASIRDSNLVKKTLEAIRTRRNTANVTSGPLHILLLAYARTGSSFIGDLMQSLPSSFYHFEPLHFIKGPVLNDSFDEARVLLADLFACNISRVEGFLPWNVKHKNYMKLQRNTRYWKSCSKTNVCYNGTYIDNFCRYQKIVIAKTIRLNLIEASKLFTSHPHLNLKIIYLTRDPRGTMNSRMKRPVNLWCRHDVTCADSNLFCAGINSDVNTACSLSVEKPEHFMVIRYEDISIDPYGVGEQLVKFLGFASVPEEVKVFLKTHTYLTGNFKRRPKVPGLEYSYTTFRNSSATAMSWRKQMVFRKVIQLQNACKRFLKAFGYHSYQTLQSLRTNNDMNIDLHTALGSTCNV